MSGKETILEPALLDGLPVGLRTPLLAAYGEIIRNFRERRWEPAELNGGKLCEIVYTILKGIIDGSFPSKPYKPANMVKACRQLEEAPNAVPRSVKIHIPRMLAALYEVRNNRNVGHVGGDVDPNHMDAVCVLEMSKWIMCELVRIFHDATTEQATDAVEALVERTTPIVWKVGTKLRVLDPKLPMKDKALILLYHSRGALSESDLFRWVEHSNRSVFRRDVLRPAHAARLVEYDADAQTVEISPIGIAHVENNLLTKGA